LFESVVNFSDYFCRKKAQNSQKYFDFFFVFSVPFCGYSF